MTTIKTYIKQADNGIVGHVYEHVVANHVTKEFLKRGYQQLLDYEFGARTEDGIVILKLETASSMVIKRFEKVINAPEVSSHDLKVALEQVQCEYGRTGSPDLNKLARQVRKLNEGSWTNLKDFGFTRPIKDDARDLVTSIGGFGKKNIRGFDRFDFTYTVKDCPYELKTLAVYILQIVGLLQVDHLYANLKYCYDAGDQWAEYQDLVGYSHTLTTRKTRNVSIENLRSLFDTHFTEMNSSKLIKKMVRYIKRDVMQAFPYFSRESVFAKSYQLAGIAGMNQVTTAENIRFILERIEVSIEKLS